MYFFEWLNPHLTWRCIKNIWRGYRYPNFIHRDLGQQYQRAANPQRFTSKPTSLVLWTFPTVVPNSKMNWDGVLTSRTGREYWSIGHFTNTLAWGPESSWKMRCWFHSFRGNKAQDLYCKYRGNIMFNFWNQNFWEFPSVKRGQTCEESPLTLKVAFFPQADSADNRQVRCAIEINWTDTGEVTRPNSSDKFND